MAIKQEQTPSISQDKKIIKTKVDASTIILGFTGPIGSGCSYISELIPAISLPREYKYYKTSIILRKRFEDRGIKDPTTEQLQNEGNEVRRDGGNQALIEKLFDKIDGEWDENKQNIGLVIDGLKNEAEVEFLRQFPYFFLISVHSPQQTRRERIIKDKKRFKRPEDFDDADKKDQQEPLEYGQQVSRCSYLSDIIINNDQHIPTNKKTQRENFVRSIYNKYIKLIENLHDNVRSVDSNPSIDELCMTVAYCLSKSSSCLKRKVGAVVVDIKKTDKDGNATRLEKCEMPFIVSSGYNEVPLGSFPCIYNINEEMCHRDFLQETFAQELKYCPNCGTEIHLEIIECRFCHHKHYQFVKMCRGCGKELEISYICKNEQCKKEIFAIYLPGSKGSPGKLLDMCRAMHAEEVALLKLNESGRVGENLILYVTTQPCNLCANKIVLSGVKKVVYSEPYSIIDAEEILRKANVEVARFQGVKSSAYFKLYT